MHSPCWPGKIEVPGVVAKWQGKGLQNPHRGFDSRRRLSRTNRPTSHITAPSDTGQTLVLYGRITGLSRTELLAYLAAGEQTRQGTRI
jgi:hypothetical protein